MGQPLWQMLTMLAIARLICLCAGRVFRRLPMRVLFLARSGMHTEGISNHLKSSSPRIRFLGMAIGSAISKLVDKADGRMKFDFEGQEADEVAQLQSLVEVIDIVGSLQDLQRTSNTDSHIISSPRNHPKPLPQKPSPLPSSKILVIEEIGDDEDDDDDLTPMAKPGVDPEDETDDPTLVNRNKPRAPVSVVPNYPFVICRLILVDMCAR